MSRQREIISIGEAYLAEYPDHTEPAGLAIDAAIAAKRFGHNGVPISRLGQDNAAERIIQTLAEQQIDTTHLQSDPDLQTGKLIVRSVLGRTRRQLDPKAAFDNLQWDFDLVDVAQQADAVIYGALAQRGGLSSSTIRRFLDECPKALRLCDLTNRDPGSGDERPSHASSHSPDRSVLRRLLDAADGAVFDAEAWSILLSSGAEMERESITAMLRTHELAFIVLMPQAGESGLIMHTADEVAEIAARHCESHRALLQIAILHGILRGESAAAVLKRVEMVLQHVGEHPDEKRIPDALREGALRAEE